MSSRSIPGGENIQLSAVMPAGQAEQLALACEWPGPCIELWLQQFITLARIGAAETCVVALAVFVFSVLVIACAILVFAFDTVSAATVGPLSPEGSASDLPIEANMPIMAARTNAMVTRNMDRP